MPDLRRCGIECECLREYVGLDLPSSITGSECSLIPRNTNSISQILNVFNLNLFQKYQIKFKHLFKTSMVFMICYCKLTKYVI